MSVLRNITILNSCLYFIMTKKKTLLILININSYNCYKELWVKTIADMSAKNESLIFFDYKNVSLFVIVLPHMPMYIKCKESSYKILKHVFCSLKRLKSVSLICNS